MNVRITHLDGSLPNLALMRLAGYHRAMGHDITFTRSPYRDLFEPEFDRVYGSTIFTRSKLVVDIFKSEFSGALVGGTGSGDPTTIEQVVGKVPLENSAINYDIYPKFKQSIGFTQRGCRLKCGFCVVPKKEGKNRGNMSVHEIWRGDPYPRELVLLDNDFFGQPDWREKAKEIIDFNFKVNFNQGINVRLIHEEGAEYLSRMRYYDVRFKKRRLYTAWDNEKDEKHFFKGFNILLNAGISPSHIMVYMLVGYWPGETMESILYRFNKINDAGAMPYPMVYNNKDKNLKRFQRWVCRRYYKFVPWEEYKR